MKPIPSLLPQSLSCAASLICMLALANGQTFTNSTPTFGISYITIPTGTGMIGDLNVGFSVGAGNHLEGMWPTVLMSPNGTPVTLSQPGHYGTMMGYNEGGTYLIDDEATTPMPSFIMSLPSGTYQALGFLSDFDGELADGAWSIDFGPGFMGLVSIESWSIFFTPAADATGSEMIGSTPGFSFQTLRPFTNSAAGQLRAHALRGPSKGGLASNSNLVRQQVSLQGKRSLVEPSHGWEAWAQAHGEVGEIGGGAASYDYDISGVTIGADSWLNDDILYGLVGGYSDGSMDLNIGGSDMDVTSSRVGIQGLKRWEHAYLLGTLHYGLNEYEGKRATMTGTASSDFDGNEYGGYLEMGFPIEITTSGYLMDGVTVQPLVAFQYTSLDLDGYTETGAGASNLVVGKQNASSERLSIGVLMTKDCDTRWGKLHPYVEARYTHELEEDSGIVNATFSGGGAVVSQGAALGEDFIETRAGAGLDISESMTLYGGFEGSYGNDAEANGGFVGIRISL